MSGPAAIPAPRARTEPARAASRAAGYSLVELLVVMGILAVTAAIALPALGTDLEQRLDIVELQVRDAVRHAQVLARSTRRTHGAVFDIVGDQFAVVDETGTPVTDPLTHGDYLVRLRAPGQPGGVILVKAAFGTLRSVIFDGQGVPLNSGSVTLACRDRRRVLTLDAVTGDIAGP